MDSYEATKLVFSRIKAIDPENASKIMGYLLIQDNGDKEMIRLAFGPETLLHNLIFKAKTHLSNASASASASATNPSSLSPSSAPWLPPASLSYANVVNGSSCSSTNAAASASESLYYSNISNNNSYASSDIADDFHQFQDHLSFLDESSELASSTDADHHNHHHLLKRSLSLPVHPNVCFGSDDDPNSGLGWKHCLYFAKGFCKNGTACKFHHIHSPEAATAAAIVGSPSKLSEFELSQELLLRSKASVQQRKLAAASQFMGSFPYNKCMNFLNDTQRSAALMMGDELHNKFGNCSRPERNDFFGSMNPSARQIYLTFPADSTFREEDVSNYFSIYGPVHDVRIPYQQKRMFGFVTFVYPETVKLILAKGNPHFVCDSRVLVKPYKEKGKVQEKKQQQHQQQMERGEYSSACSSPSGPFDFHFVGGRMLYNNQEMLRRKLEEQADLQQAIEMQGRRLMNLQLHLKNNHLNHQFHHGLSNGSPIPSPTLSHSPNNRTRIFPFEGSDEEVPPEESGVSPVTDSQITDHLFHREENRTSNHNKNNNSDGNDKEEKPNSDENDLCDSLEHILPDNLFASPKKSAGGPITVFSSASAEVDEKNTSSVTSTNNNTKLPSTSLNMSSLNSCLLHMSRFSSGQGTIGM
ncbi:zinc finger CCCH domain-containing protein 53 isoform X3 [Citrus clementina]|uniref:zinc finger CCCH domain-containing protein 53 isoform X3 n=1 Tax=Citrus clementina TaxID=85681 RepID=UPI000CED15E7|nr:zinc finger CCCH domain-containing protein 53 isoform X3 [Citrus x clementina]